MDIKEYTQKLREERMSLIGQVNGVYDDAVKRPEGQRALSAEETQKVERMDARIAEIEAEVKTADDAETRSRESAAAREAHERQYGTKENERRERSLGDEFRAWATGRERRTVVDTIDEGNVVNGWHVNIAGAALMRQYMRQGYQGEELRTLLWDTGSVGSTVPTLLDNTLYQYLTAGIAAERMPTTKLDTASGAPMDFPTVAAHGIATQVIAQGTAIGGTDPTFAKITLNSYKFGQLLGLASEVIQDSGVNIIEFVGSNIGRAVAQRVDLALIAGSGSDTPQGMTTAALVGAAGTVASGGTLPAGSGTTPIPYEALVDLVYSVNDQYRQMGCAWLMRDATAGQLRKLRDGAGGTVGAVMWQPSLTQGIQGGEPDRLLDFPIYTDPNVASLASNSKPLFFGDWSAYFRRTVGGFVLDRSDEFGFNTDLIYFRGKTRVDGDYIDLTAVNVMKNSVT